MVDEPYTRQDYPCSECCGCGQIVEPLVTTADDGTIDVQQVAHMCRGCGGSGKA